MDTREFFNRLAPEWDARQPRVLPARGATAILCGAGEGLRALDIACGTGIMESELLALGVGKIVAIDLAEEMISRAREKFAGDRRVEFIAGDLMKFTAAPFDLALMYNAYPHFTDKPALLNKVASLLKRGGRFTVAHGAGRDTINAHHGSCEAQAVSAPLRPAREESEKWKPFFDVDIIADTPYIYVISGIVK